MSKADRARRKKRRAAAKRTGADEKQRQAEAEHAARAEKLKQADFNHVSRSVHGAVVDPRPRKPEDKGEP